MTIINKGKLYKTAGWTLVVIGFYLVGMGVVNDGDDETIIFNRDDGVIDAEFTIIDY